MRVGAGWSPCPFLPTANRRPPPPTVPPPPAGSGRRAGLGSGSAAGCSGRAGEWPERRRRTRGAPERLRLWPGRGARSRERGRAAGRRRQSASEPARQPPAAPSAAPLTFQLRGKLPSGRRAASPPLGAAHRGPRRPAGRGEGRPWPPRPPSLGGPSPIPVLIRRDSVHNEWARVAAAFGARVLGEMKWAGPGRSPHSGMAEFPIALLLKQELCLPPPQIPFDGLQMLTSCLVTFTK